MYCIKCGAELSEDSKFCFNCGASIKRKGIIQRNESKRSIFVSSVTILGVVIVLIASMFVYKIFMLKNETDTVSEVAAGKKSVDDLGDLVGYENADSYIEAATACVERGDLYGAKNILETGYSDTRDDSLLNVSILGPLSCYENVLLTEELPVINTCEYVFSNDTVTGNIYFLESSAVRIEYFFSSTEERLIGEVITAYNMMVAGVDSKADEILKQDVYYCFDCLYNEKGEVVSLVDAYSQEEFATMEYENGRCTSVNYMEIDFFFEYDEKGRISSVTIPDSDSNLQMHFEYDPDGSYTIRGSAGMSSDLFRTMEEPWKMSVNQRGFLQELIVGEERIIEVEFGERGEILHSNGFMDDHYGSGKQLEYEYNENENISRVLIFGTGSGSTQEDNIEAEVKYSYDSKNRMTDIVYNNSDGTDTKSVYGIWSYHIDYDQNGRGVRIEETDTGDQKTIYEISYSDDGKIEAIKGEVDKEIYVYKYEYDIYGRWIGRDIVEMDEENVEIHEDDMQGSIGTMNIDGTSEANRHNGGWVTEQGDWNYYCIDGMILKENVITNQKYMIYDGSKENIFPTGSLQVMGKWLYFEGGDNLVCRLSIDGNQFEFFNAEVGRELIEDWDVYNEKVYFIVRENISASSYNYYLALADWENGSYERLLDLGDMTINLAEEPMPETYYFTFYADSQALNNLVHPYHDREYFCGIDQGYAYFANAELSREVVHNTERHNYNYRFYRIDLESLDRNSVEFEDGDRRPGNLYVNDGKIYGFMICSSKMSLNTYYYDTFDLNEQRCAVHEIDVLDGWAKNGGYGEHPDYNFVNGKIVMARDGIYLLDEETKDVTEVTSDYPDNICIAHEMIYYTSNDMHCRINLDGTGWEIIDPSDYTNN